MPKAGEFIEDLKSILKDNESHMIVENNVESKSENSVDEQLLFSSLATKLKSLGKESEGQPLTTRAVKELEKAKKERVYSKTIIRIK